MYNVRLSTILVLMNERVEEPEFVDWEDLITYQDKIEPEDGKELPLLHED